MTVLTARTATLGVAVVVLVCLHMAVAARFIDERTRSKRVTEGFDPEERMELYCSACENFADQFLVSFQQTRAYTHPSRPGSKTRRSSFQQAGLEACKNLTSDKMDVISTMLGVESFHSNARMERAGRSAPSYNVLDHTVSDENAALFKNYCDHLSKEELMDALHDQTVDLTYFTHIKDWFPLICANVTHACSGPTRPLTGTELAYEQAMKVREQQRQPSAMQEHRFDSDPRLSDDPFEKKIAEEADRPPKPFGM
eukprot:CAMPEP_0114557404 /NCGR_PEP_ID=MMETSP0114-20121206/9814_1 /TAXON_ID=31324 /ORGANISM="Goniomonas sp, Strain m" /LENGTH=254 /DNA_ID=CAMNT_0001742693 /DNA_START=15 /DNA_END=779 /DNA_ORIENTATION=+